MSANHLVKYVVCSYAFVLVMEKRMAARRVTMRHLECFCAVMDSGGITAAAGILGISQPAASKLVSQLEKATRLELFVRRPRQILPTREAQLLHAEATGILRGVDYVLRVAEEIRELKRGRLGIVSMPSIGLHFLPRVITAFQAAHPGTEVSLQVESSRVVLERAAAQQLDLGLSVLAPNTPAVASESLVRVEAVAVMPPGHPKASLPGIRPQDFEGEAFVSLSWQDRSRHLVDHVFDTAGVRRRMELETHYSEMACEFVASGAGVSIVDAFSAYEYTRRSELVARPFTPKILYDIQLVWPAVRKPSALQLAFVAHIRRAADDWQIGLGTQPLKQSASVRRRPRAGG